MIEKRLFLQQADFLKTSLHKITAIEDILRADLLESGNGFSDFINEQADFLVQITQSDLVSICDPSGYLAYYLLDAIEYPTVIYSISQDRAYENFDESEVTWHHINSLDEMYDFLIHGMDEYPHHIILEQ